jgi:segregation and condensation protein B
MPLAVTDDAGTEPFASVADDARAEPLAVTDDAAAEPLAAADDARVEPLVVPDDAAAEPFAAADDAPAEQHPTVEQPAELTTAPEQLPAEPVITTDQALTESASTPDQALAEPVTTADQTPTESSDATHVDQAEPPTATDPPPTDPDADPPTDVLDEDQTPELTDTELESTLEALLLTVDSPVDEESLASAADTTVARVNATLLRMATTYTEHDRGLDLRHAGGGWRYYTRDRYAPYVEKLLLGGQRAKLTRAALETLAVIAYRQPVTRARVAAVRGVNCDGVIRTLLARGLVEETGTDQETGGFLYRTTELFLERLGLSSLEDLPPIAPLLPEVDSIDDV